MALTLGGIIGACGLFCGFLSWSETVRKVEDISK